MMTFLFDTTKCERKRCKRLASAYIKGKKLCQRHAVQVLNKEVRK